jgi:hypothetical protein
MHDLPRRPRRRRTILTPSIMVNSPRVGFQRSAPSVLGGKVAQPPESKSVEKTSRASWRLTPHKVLCRGAVHLKSKPETPGRISQKSAWWWLVSRHRQHLQLTVRTVAATISASSMIDDSKFAPVLNAWVHVGQAPQCCHECGHILKYHRAPGKPSLCRTTSRSHGAALSC